MSNDIKTKLNESGLPFVTVKFAQSLDGRIATRTGDSKWISSEGARRFAHQLRTEHDAILVGIGTVLADDPQLTSRLVDGRDPLRIIVDPRIETPPAARVLAGAAAAQTLIACREDAPASRVAAMKDLGAEVLRLPARGADAQTRLDLRRLLRELGQRDIASLLVEGGSRIITSLLAERLVDRLVVAVAPIIIGRGIEAIGDLGVSALGDAIRFSSVETHPLGDDVIFDGRLEP